MLTTLKGLFKTPKSRLSRRIVFWVFVCVIAIETIIFIPSFNNREQELLSHLNEVWLAKITSACQAGPTNPSGEVLLNQLKTLHAHSPGLVGGTLYQSNGSIVGDFGVPPPFSFDDL
jgi:hypothetical protein